MLIRLPRQSSWRCTPTSRWTSSSTTPSPTSSAAASTPACVWARRPAQRAGAADAQLAEQAQHHEDEHARDRDVEPYGEGVAGDPLVPGEAPREREEQAQEHQRQRDRREGDVRDEDEEIRWADQPLPGEVRVAVHRVIDDVRDEK